MIKKYRVLYFVASALGVLGLLDVITRTYVATHYQINDMGIVSLGVLYVLAKLFGAAIGGSVAVLLSLLLSLSIIWFFVAYFLKKKADNLEHPTEENKKAQNNALTRVAIALGVLVFLPMLFVMAMLASNGMRATGLVVIGILIWIVLRKRKSSKIKA